MLVAGVDSSTQSVKVVLCRAEDGTVTGEGSAPHPAGTECDPEAWWAALRQAGDGLLDRADASGTGYFATPRGEWLPGLAETALGHRVALPRVAGPGEVVGRSAGGALLAAGTGGNMAAALGLGLEPGEIAVSAGTSGTAFAVSGVPADDESGAVAGFADATGRYLPLVCTANAGLVLAAVARLIGTDLPGLSRAALAAPPGAGGITLLPYFDGERTPLRPDATGIVSGLTTANAIPQNLARAAIEGVLASLADAAARLADFGVRFSRVLLIGGGARSAAMRALAPGMFGHEVDVPEPCEYVALGAARQAAWALAGPPEPPAGRGRPPSGTTATSIPTCWPGTPLSVTPARISATTRAGTRLAPFPRLNQTFKIREFPREHPPLTAPED